MILGITIGVVLVFLMVWFSGFREYQYKDAIFYATTVYFAIQIGIIVGCALTLIQHH